MKSTKKAILAGTMALAFLGGGALYSTSAAHAASTTPEKAPIADKAQAPKGIPAMLMALKSQEVTMLRTKLS